MHRPYRSQFNQRDRTRINDAIRAKSLRVVGPKGENLGVLSRAEALKWAEKSGLDLIEISSNTEPPVAKIMNFGQFRYQKKRKASVVKARSHVTETKNVQVKIGTSEHDQRLKANRAAEWLEEGHRVKVDLFLWGRYKYMDPDFLKERLERFMKIIPAEYKVADEMKKSPKGWSCIIERIGKVTAKRLPAIKSEALTEAKQDTVTEAKTADTTTPEVAKSKRKTLDELIDLEMGE